MPAPAVDLIRRATGAAAPGVLFARVAGCLVAGCLVAACGSPRQGDWRGTFDGTVSGTVEMTVNARGTRCQGTMTGRTAEGQPFEADLEGVLRQDFLNADFRGRTGLQGAAGGLPLSFRGSMTGFLDLERGQGQWQATLAANSYAMSGSFVLRRVEATSE